MQGASSYCRGPLLERSFIGASIYFASLYWNTVLDRPSFGASLIMHRTSLYWIVPVLERP